MKNLSYGDLKAQLYYDGLTGYLYRQGTHIFAGGYRKDGYHLVSVNNKRYLGHRLIWMLENGLDYNQLPKIIDHIDGNPANNQISNLRACNNNRENLLNCKPQDGTSRYKGVVYRAEMNKYTAQIMVNRKSIYLGAYAKEEEAAQAYNEAAKFHFKEYARIN